MICWSKMCIRDRGEGGPELVKQLLSQTYDINMPGVVAIYLTGSPRPGVGPQDVYKRQGYTYIEIDLTAQRMVFYKDGTPTADAQIVSGNPFVPN